MTDEERKKHFDFVNELQTANSLVGPKLRLGQPSELSTARRKLWCDVWVSLARVENCAQPEIATRWADVAVKDFDERFGPKEEKA